MKESIQGPINSAYAVEERPGNAPHTPQSFTKEQLQQILDMLKKDAEPTIHALTGTGLAILDTLGYSYSKWILDSGATIHMIADLKLLNNCREHKGPMKTIKIPDGNYMTVTHV